MTAKCFNIALTDVQRSHLRALALKELFKQLLLKMLG